MQLTKIGLTILLSCTFLPALAVDKIVVLALFKNKVVVKIDGKRRLLTTGKPSPEGVRLITSDSDKAIIEVNGAKTTYKLGSHITTNYSQGAAKASVQIWPNRSGMYFVNGNINSFPVRFLVDTGATSIAMNKNEAKRLGINYRLDGLEGRTSTASGVVKAYYVKLKKVKVGDILLRDVEAGIIDGNFPREVLLGNSFLNKVRMIRHGQMMELQKK